MTSRRRAAIAVAGASAAWGTSGAAQALGDLGAPVLVGATRTVSGAVALAIVAAVVARRQAVVPVHDASRATAALPPERTALLAAGLGVPVAQVAYFASAESTGVAVSTVVAIGSVPVFAGVLARIVDGARVTPRWWLATVLAVSGCTLVLLSGSGAVGVDRAGVVLALVSGAAYAVVTVAGGRLLASGLRPTLAMARVFAVGSVPALVIVLISGPSALLSPRAGLLVLWLAVVTVALAYLLYAQGLRVLPAATVGTLTLVEPLVAAGLGVIVLGERPGSTALVGAIVLVGGLVLVATERPPRPR